MFKTNRDTIPTLEIERFPQEGFLRDENFKSIDEKELGQRVSGFRSILYSFEIPRDIDLLNYRFVVNTPIDGFFFGIGSVLNTQTNEENILFRFQLAFDDDSTQEIAWNAPGAKFKNSFLEIKLFFDHFLHFEKELEALYNQSMAEIKKYEERLQKEVYSWCISFESIEEKIIPKSLFLYAFSFRDLFKFHDPKNNEILENLLKKYREVLNDNNGRRNLLDKIGSWFFSSSLESKDIRGKIMNVNQKLMGLLLLKSKAELNIIQNNTSSYSLKAYIRDFCKDFLPMIELQLEMNEHEDLI